MRGSFLRAVVAAIALMLVMAQARIARPQLLSPGPLSKAHASMEGDQHCVDCHSSGKRVDQGGCLKCHNDLGARIAAGKGLHGLTFKGKACEGCHVEHLGGPALLRWPGGDPSKLDHAETGWPLIGAHKSTPCAKCHNKVNARNNPTYLGASSSCTSCHKDPHDGRFGPACLNCHNEAAWGELTIKEFNHDLARFTLRGAHATVPCAKCHFEPSKYVGLKFAACIDCHKDPHGGRLGAGCTDCHDDARWKPVTFTHTAARHPGTSLANGHAAVPCRACHDQGNLVSPSKGKECVSCHKPVHKAPFGRTCAGCHASIQWIGLPVSVGMAAHARTEYPLTGKHESVKCAGCHKPEMARESRYRGLAFARCADCHQDQHRGEFAKVAGGGECGPCHATAGFYPTLFDLTAHSSTTFPLIGKHVAPACIACHKAPRPRFDLRVTKGACADCHANPHGDQFAKEMAEGGCGQCHQPSGWSLPKIDHSIWPLTGAHATAQCDSCHHPTAEDRKAGSGASYRGVPRSCGGCHDDAHDGQFRLAPPVLECDRCHATRTFKIASFDHQAVTGYALTGAHAKVDCAKCHPMAELAGGHSTRRFRLPSHECSFCHANPHQPQERAVREQARASPGMAL